MGPTGSVPGPLDEERADQLAAALRVLADPAQLRILNLRLSQPTVSHHLMVLHDAGLIRRGQRGN